MSGPPAPPPVVARGRLAVDDGHELGWEVIGSDAGVPVVFCHGGPGSGCVDGHRSLFGDAHRAVLFDQRSAGTSTPSAADDVDWRSIHLEAHLADMESLRRHLGVASWVVVGLSWGSTLALAYAQRHRERTDAVVVGAVSLGTRADIDWITVHLRRLLPEAWAELRAHVPERLRSRRLVQAYRELVLDDDPAVHGPAATAWCRWEDAVVHPDRPPRTPGTWHDDRYRDPRFRLAFARQVTHCWADDCWLGPDQLVRDIERLHGTPGWVVHGRSDVSSPLDGPWRLHRAWPGSRLHVVDGAGHGGVGALVRELLAGPVLDALA